jgi:Neuraminidase (sialidase)
VAFVRDGSSNLYAFVNGTQIGATLTSSQNIHGGTGGVYVAYANGSGDYLPGWIDELRISKGIARWTSNFTVPSAEYSTPTYSGTATVVSNAYSEPSAPTEAMVIPDETLNTGSITYYVSRDNGTTWTQVTKETVTSISSQPSGTQLKWKAVITGDAELNAIAVAV